VKGQFLGESTCPGIPNDTLPGSEWHFQAKLADCRWMAVYHLQLDCFLPIVGEMLSAGGSIMLGAHYQ